MKKILAILLLCILALPASAKDRKQAPTAGKINTHTLGPAPSRRSGVTRVRTPRTRRYLPNDYWLNRGFADNFETVGLGTPLSDGTCGSGAFGRSQYSWATWTKADDYFDLTRAWAITTGDTNLVVAITDKEIAWNHYDLKENIAYNWAEHAGTAGVDDDNNGLIDDIHGWNFVGWNNEPGPPFSDPVAMAAWGAADNNQHGTQMAGIICATGDNEPSTLEPTSRVQGTCGMVPHARLLPLRILSIDEYPETSPHELIGGQIQSAEYICELKDSGAMDIRVVSMSWVTPGDDIIALFISSGILPVSGAGNNNGTAMTACGNDSILCMSAVNAAGKKTTVDDSPSYGSGVDLCGWVSASGGSGYFLNEGFPYTEGNYGFRDAYADNMAWFSLGWWSAPQTSDIAERLDWCGNYTPRYAIEPYELDYGIMPSRAMSSGSAAQGAGAAMMVFSAYPEVGPLQCKAMLERGASTRLYDGRNDDQCGDSEDCDGMLGAGGINVYRSITMWGAISDTTLSGTIYVSGDTYFGANVVIEANTVFRIAPEDIYHTEILQGGWLDCQEQYRIPALDNAPSDLTDTVEIYIGAAVTAGNPSIFTTDSDFFGDDDWGGIWLQTGGSISNVLINGTERGDILP